MGIATSMRKASRTGKSAHRSRPCRAWRVV